MIKDCYLISIDHLDTSDMLEYPYMSFDFLDMYYSPITSEDSKNIVHIMSGLTVRDANR